MRTERTDIGRPVRLEETVSSRAGDSFDRVAAVASQPSVFPPVRARIFRPAPAPNQSGRARSENWILEFEPRSPRWVEPLMGWTATDDPIGWRKLRFRDRDSAVAFASSQGWEYEITGPRPTRIRPKSYAVNFLRSWKK